MEQRDANRGDLRRNLGLSEDECFPRDTDDSFIRSASGRRRQDAAGFVGDVDPDDGEIAVIEFEDVGATRGAGGLPAIGVRVRSDSTEYFHGVFWFWQRAPGGFFQKREQWARHKRKRVRTCITEAHTETIACSHFGSKEFCWDFESVTKTVHSALSQILCDHIRTLREAAAMTQRDLARAIGREHGMIARVELGERRVDLAEAYQIFTALGVKPEEEAATLMTKFSKAAVSLM